MEDLSKIISGKIIGEVAMAEEIHMEAGIIIIVMVVIVMAVDRECKEGDGHLNKMLVEITRTIFSENAGGAAKRE